jgi:GNAT superfamily N-acetyltransferase
MQISKYTGGRHEEVLDLIEETALAAPHKIKFDKDYWSEWLKVITEPTDSYLVLLSEDAGKIVGILVGQIYLGHPLVQHSKVAVELFWYVKPEHRGRKSFLMVDLYEKWAMENGATHICMSLLDNEHKTKLDRIYRAKGYSPMETQYMKVIDNAY